MKKGFTLVELSIVLVIIGLLIGGVLVAQSMISAAQTQEVVSKANQFRILIQAFKDKTNYWPGDAPSSIGIPATGVSSGYSFAGDGDGVVEHGLNGESMRALSHIIYLNMYPGADYGKEHYRDVCHLSGRVQHECYINGPHKNAEPASFKLSRVYESSSEFYTFPYGVALPDNSNYKTNEYYITYGQYITQSNIHQSHQSLLTPLEALSIDRKSDDGVATTGNVRGHPGYGGCDWPGCDCLDDGDIRDGVAAYGDDYNLDKTTVQCIVMFYLGVGDEISPVSY